MSTKGKLSIPLTSSCTPVPHHLKPKVQSRQTGGGGRSPTCFTDCGSGRVACDTVVRVGNVSTGKVLIHPHVSMVSGRAR